MTLRIVVPMRPLSEAKSRLGAALSPAARAALARGMFEHVIDVAQSLAPTFVVSRDLGLLARAMHPVHETGHGLNPALEQAVAQLDGTGPVLALSADLPLLGRADLEAMVAMLDQADVIAAPDRAGTGTNALLLSRPGLIPYAFGEGSLAAHRAGAGQADLRFAQCDRPGLASDIDRPEDLALLPPGPLSAA